MTRADAKLGDHVTLIIRDAVTLAERQHVRVKCLYNLTSITLTSCDWSECRYQGR